MLWMYVVHILLVPDGVHVSIGEKRVEKKKKKPTTINPTGYGEFVRADMRACGDGSVGTSRCPVAYPPSCVDINTSVGQLETKHGRAGCTRPDGCLIQCPGRCLVRNEVATS